MKYTKKKHGVWADQKGITIDANVLDTTVDCFPRLIVLNENEFIVLANNGPGVYSMGDKSLDYLLKHFPEDELLKLGVIEQSPEKDYLVQCRVKAEGYNDAKKKFQQNGVLVVEVRVVE